MSILNFATKEWRQLDDFHVLPSGAASALALEGNYLWVGGSGYIAKIDPLKNELLKYSTMRAPSVDQLQIGGGFTWAKFDRHLYRAKLPLN